jgi:cytochrome P450 enzyme
MASTESTRELRFDPWDPSFVKDPYPTLARFREEAPVHFWDAGKGYMFFRYRDLMALFRESRLGHDPTLGAGFPPEMKAAFPDFVALRESDLFLVDAASHARIRKLVNPIFGPRAVEAHRAKVTAIIGSILDALPREGTINAFGDFARNYPVRVIAGLLNIPSGHDAEFIALAEALIGTILPNMPPEVFASYMPAVSRGVAVVRECIAERRANPMENDVLSQLIHARDAEERLSEEELLSLVSGLVIGGSDTTVHLTTYAIMELLRHPDQLALLRAQPSLARGALDETLRYNSFGRSGLGRFVKEPFTYEGAELVPGMPVYLNMLAAFRDPEFAPDAETYDIRRPITTSPWFGFGPHFCLGASLARMEAEIALRMFFERYPSTELAAEPVYGTHPVLRDIVDLPVRVTAGPVA